MKYVAGDVIIATSKPVVYAVNLRNKGKVCDRCLKNCDGLKRCSKCHFMSYCSVKCQRDDWKEFHKHECLIIDEMLKMKMEIPTTIHCLIRMSIKKQYAKSIFQRTWTLYDGSERSIEDLSSHMSVTFSQQEANIPETMTKILNHFGISSDVDTVTKHLRQLLVNLYGITNDLWFLKGEDPMIAGGLYVEPSVFDHSCRPNAICVFNGPVLTVRALREIDTGKEKITISYQEGTLLLPKDLRQIAIRKFCHFDCQCNFCLDSNQPGDADDDCVQLTKLLSCAMSEENFDEVNKIFKRIFHLIQIALGRYSKPWIEYMVLFMQFKCDQIRKHGQKEVIQDVIEWTEFQSYLRKTHGTEHPLYNVCIEFGKIICPNNMLYITGNAENPDILTF